MDARYIIYVCWVMGLKFKISQKIVELSGVRQDCQDRQSVWLLLHGQIHTHNVVVCLCIEVMLAHPRPFSWCNVTKLARVPSFAPVSHITSCVSTVQHDQLAGKASTRALWSNPSSLLHKPH